MLTNTKNTPVEAIERSFPLPVLPSRLRPESGSAGRHPGGAGIERDLLVLEDTTGVALRRAACVAAVGPRRRRARGAGGELAAAGG